MLRSIYALSLRERSVATIVTMIGMGAFLVLAMAAYGEIGTELYADLPEAMRGLMGIPDGADAGILAYSVVYGMLAAMTLAGLAISLGADAVAGQERDGTIGVLLGNPRSRRDVLRSGIATLVTLGLTGGAIALAAGLLAPVALGVSTTGVHVAALVVHLVANALLFGLFATAIGAWTGNRQLALTSTAGFLALQYVAVGLLPLFDGVAGVAKVLPWFWFDGHDPLTNGLDVGWLALQSGTASALAAAAWVGVDRRDLRKPMSQASLLDRLTSHPTVAVALDRVTGSARLGSIWARTVSDGQGLALVVGMILFGGMGLLMGPMYAALSETLAEVSTNLPEALLAVVGGGDMSTPEGWYRLETFGLMAPICLTLVAVMTGARALGGEEQRRTMAVLLANPISRRNVVLQKAVAMVVLTTLVGFALFLGVTGGSWLGGLGMSIGNIAAACLLATLLGLLFGSVALAIGAATGQVRVAAMATAGLAALAYGLNAVLSIGESLARWAVVSPFDWYLGSDPLVAGIAWGDAAMLAVPTLALVAVSVILFDRRDLRRG